jgi:transcriptional regulator with AAA-type ATPase domain
LLRALAARAGQVLTERRASVAGETFREGSWVLVNDLDAGEQVLAPRRGRVLATASGPELAREASFEVVLALPPLYARPSEVPVMAEAFLAQARVLLGRPRLHLAPEALPLLTAFRWPGNVLELRNVMFRAARAAVRDEVGKDSLPLALSSIAPVENLRGAMESAERELLLEALSRTRWNVSAAAGRLGMARRTVVYRMQRLGLKRPAR